MSGLAAAAPPAGDDREPAGILVDTADIPSGGQLDLVRYGDDYEILFGDEQLMGSWVSRSEEALATLVLEPLGPRAESILIGGLGMGFTLAAARSVLPANASIRVAELVPKIVEWASGPLAHLFGDSLDDPRVSVDLRDVHDIIVEAPGRFDAILLDVDNGPDGLIKLANERLYCNWGLRAIRDTLRSGGVLGVWSAYPDAAFRQRLVDAGFAVQEVSVAMDDADRSSPDVIWIATKAN